MEPIQINVVMYTKIAGLLAHPWCVDAKWSDYMREQLEAGQLYIPAFAAEAGLFDTPESLSYTVEDGVGILKLEGPMTKEPLCSMSGGGCSTVLAGRAIDKMVRDDTVKSMLLLVDSPGGTSDGLPSFSQKIARAASAKPLYTYVDGACCSAMYWIASQTMGIFSNESDAIGSIGVRTALIDSSEAYKMRGLKTIVVDTGPHKSTGAPGTQITDEQVAKLRESVDHVFGLFKTAIMNGRGMSAKAVDAIGTGEIWIGSAAVAAGVTDGIMTFEEMMTFMREAGMDASEAKTGVKSSSTKNATRVAGGVTMSEEKIGLLARVAAAMRGGDDGSAPNATANVGTVWVGDPVGFDASLKAAGVTDKVSLDALIARANLGDEYLTERRAYALKQSVRLYGAANGQRIAEVLQTSIEMDDIQSAIKSWETEADAKFGIGKNDAGGGSGTAATRVTKTPVMLEAHSTDADATPDENAKVNELLSLSSRGQAVLREKAKGGN